MRLEHLRDLDADREHRIEAVIGSWKIIAICAPAHPAPLALGQRQEIAAVETDLARVDTRPAVAEEPA